MRRRSMRSEIGHSRLAANTISSLYIIQRKLNSHFKRSKANITYITLALAIYHSTCPAQHVVSLPFIYSQGISG